MNLQINGYSIINIFSIAFLSSFILTFFVKKIAVHINAIDIPNERKVHKKPMPRVGGLAIFFAFLFGYVIFGTISTQMISILIGGFIIIITGIIDDIKPIKAKYKFLMQLIAAAVVVMYGGLYFNDLSILGQVYVFPEWVNMNLSIIFMVACINIINLIDGLDGLASGISLIYFITIATVGIVLNKFGGLDVILSVIMAGCTLGFLFHNFPPAKIFLGDTGSMFLGFIISVIALIGYKVATVTSIISPIILLTIPILDTLLAIIRRMLKKQSISTPDKEHLHHQLLRMTSSTTKTILLIYFIDILFSLTTIFYVLGDDKQALFLYLCLMIFFFIVIFKTDILFKHKKNQ